MFQAVAHCNANSERDNLTRKIGELVKIDAVGYCFGVEYTKERYESEIGEIY